MHSGAGVIRYSPFSKILQPAATLAHQHQSVSRHRAVDFLDSVISPTGWPAAVDTAGKYLSFETVGRSLGQTCWQAHGRGGGAEGDLNVNPFLKKMVG